MIRKSFFLVSIIVIFLSISPMLLYWWGLSNIEAMPTPSETILTPEQERKIWLEAKEAGNPRIRSLNPYSYLMALECKVNKGLFSYDCMNDYPGLRLSALAIRKQVSEQVNGEGNTVWQFSWMAYTIWATRNWNIHEILATYYSSFSWREDEHDTLR